MAEFSRVLYRLLDHLGYNHDMIKFRRESWKYWAEINYKSWLKGQVYEIAAGSKGEGITAVLENDVDTVTLDNSVLCIITPEQLPSHLPNELTVLLADMENVPPGYTRLKLHQPSSFRNVRNSDIRDCLFEMQNGEVYLSSTLFTSMLKNSGADRIISNSCISGPAYSGTAGHISFDHVVGFTFHCPQLLQKWASRRRRHEWPRVDIIRKACSFLPQVVPVGAKGSDRQFQEWRFCFIESELTLTHSLNGTQIKLYILLKMITKNILKHVTGEISSYIMKNITYWLSELLPLHVFREEKLVSLVLLALTFLRTAITRWNNLPYYMIPSRNLLSERLDARTQKDLSDLLFQLEQEGPRLFLRVEKLRNSLETACLMPSYVISFGYKRDQMEKRIIAGIILDVLRGFGIYSDIQTKTLLTRQIQSLVVSCLHSLYPSRYVPVNEHTYGQMFMCMIS